MNWVTMRTEIIRELHQDSSSVPAAILADVQRAMCDAIRYNRRHGLLFNVKNGTFYTITDQHRYALPEGFISIHGDVFFSPTSGSGTIASGRHVMREMGSDVIEEVRFPRDDYDGEQVTGTSAQWYGIDVGNSQFLIAPTPSVDGNRIDFRYVCDVGTPEYKYDTSTSLWKFYIPGTMEAIPDEYSNAWLNEGRDLVKARALYTLWSSIYGGTQEAAMKAQAWMQRWAEELVRLRAETARKASRRSFKRYL